MTLRYYLRLDFFCFSHSLTSTTSLSLFLFLHVGREHTADSARDQWAFPPLLFFTVLRHVGTGAQRLPALFLSRSRIAVYWFNSSHPPLAIWRREMHTLPAVLYPPLRLYVTFDSTLSITFCRSKFSINLPLHFQREELFCSAELSQRRAKGDTLRAHNCLEYTPIYISLKKNP